jgi:hypothetical protein
VRQGPLRGRALAPYKYRRSTEHGTLPRVLATIASLTSSFDMDLCEACIRLARQVSTSSDHTREVHTTKGTELLVSAERCRLCKYLTSCLFGMAYSSTSVEWKRTNTTVGEWLRSHPGFRGPLEFEVFELLSYCEFYVGTADIDDQDNDGYSFTIYFWAEPGTSSLKVATFVAKLSRYCSFHIR